MRPTVVLAAAAALAVGSLSAGPARAVLPPASATQPARAAGSIGMGQVGTGICGVTGPGAAAIDTQAAGQPSYVAPRSGVLTSFSHLANGQAGTVQLIVFADGATPTQKTVAAKSAKLTVATNKLNTFVVQVPIKAGQKIGIGFSATNMACATAADFAGDSTLVKASFDADTSGTFVADGTLSSTGHTFRPNISAVLEPDVDKDGFGDVTQDGCTQSAHVTVTCPDTKITKRPRNKSTRNKVLVKVEFTASIAGSTFECRLDGHKKWKKCKSPYKRRLGPGSHVVQVRAVSPSGVADPKPAKAKFSIRKKR